MVAYGDHGESEVKVCPLNTGGGMPVEDNAVHTELD